jgi:hypothetical protein
MEEPKVDTDEGVDGDDPSRCMDEDPYGSDAEEQNPFGHEDLPVLQGQVAEAVPECGVVGGGAGSGASSSDTPILCPTCPKETFSERLAREFIARKARKLNPRHNVDEAC